MLQTLPCPEAHDLQRFLLGQLARADADYLEEHLVHCQRCLTKVPALKASDAVVEAMRALAVSDEPEKDMVEGLINRLQQLQPAGKSQDTDLNSAPSTEVDQASGKRRYQEADTLDDPVLAGRASRTEIWTGSAESSRKAPSLEAMPAGLTIAGYDVLGELGRGGMGVVYKARQRSLNRLVALKMILSGAHAGAAERARFRSEAEVLARLQHPHIVQIYEIGDHEGRPFLALEFIEGRSLTQCLKSAPQNARSSAQLVEILARAMQAAHERGIIHRDLKPANILLVRSERPQAVALGSADEGGRYEPKITDFGLAKQLDKGPGHSETGLVVGTPSYMAPEQAQGKTREIGPPADIYALGAILYDLLAARPPFKAETPIETITQVIHHDPVPPSQLQPTVARDLETICLKCLQKEPQRRYPSARALADDLARFLAGEPIQARPVGLWERAIKWARRRPVAAALAGVSCLTAISLLFGAFIWAEYQYQQAQVAVKDSELARQKLEDYQTLAAGLEKAQGALLAGKVYLASGDFQNARMKAAEALNRIAAVETLNKAGSEPRLEEFKAEAEQLLKEANQRLDDLEASRIAEQKRDQFITKRDKAIFAESHLGGLDAGFSQKATRTAAIEALAVFGIGPQRGIPLNLDSHYSDGRKQEIVAGCYSLLLMLAEAVAQPLESENRVKQLEEALRILDQAAQLRAATTRAYHRRRANYLRQLGRQVDADAEQRQADRLRAEEAVDYFLLGDEAYQRRDWPQAIDYFKRTLHLEPEHFWARFLIAIAFMQLPRPDPEQAETHLTFCQSRQPDFVWIYLVRGYVNGELGRRALDAKLAQAGSCFDAAEEDFRKAQERLNLNPDEEAAYNLVINRGVMHCRQEKFTEAIQELQHASQLRPDKVNAYINLAEVFRAQERWDEAVAQLDRAIQLRGSLAMLYHARGRLNLERRDLARALPDFDKAIELYGSDNPSTSERGVLAEDYAQRGRILHQQQRSAEALKAYDEALRLLPGYSLALRSRATLHFEQKRYAQAIEDFDAYLKRWQPAPEIYEARGLARTALKDYDGGILDYTQAINLEPTSRRYALRGWVHVFREAPRQALRDFDEAIQRDGANGDAFAGRGYAQVRLGHLTEALADAGKALRHAPPTAEQARRHLYNVARIFAQAAGQVKVEARPPYRGIQDQRLYYQARAVELIVKALGSLSLDQRVEFWRDYIQEDAAFNPIRRSEGFAQVAAKYARPIVRSP
jgi:serine/threonine protein kinase/Tfp pilus assembly protein PilF